MGDAAASLEAPVPSSISRTRTTSRDARRLTPAALLALLLALVLALTACGSDADAGSDAPAESSDSAWPVTVAGADGDLTIEERPEAIVSLSATSTEMLFAI